ncbi:MAG: Type IV secretory pathway VirB4 component-like protein [Parcubacteria group bacterium GW2011_GWF2_39_13b]|nr:MAG: Type IV secretory pathway VirB4 component-like protein [Parcubacteria group bacterium GW2011_GWF2_39_13b]
MDFLISSAKPENQPARLETAPIRDLIAPAGLRINSNYLEIGEKLCRTLFVFTYPRYLTTNWLSPVLTLDRQMNISLFVHPTDSAVILKNLRKKVAQVQSQISLKQEQGQVRDPILETALQDIEQLRNTLQQGTEKFFQVGLYISFFANTLKELDETENQLRALMEVRMVYAKPATFQQEEGFLSTLPLGTDLLLIHNPMNSAPLASFFPFVSMDLTDNKGVLYGINRHNNSLILFDRFTLENSNMVIFAKSGAGKSYFVKLEILRSLMMGTEVIVVDPEKEYKYLAETVGGSFIDISLSSPNHLNPFDLPLPREDELPEDILRNNIINLVGLLRIMLGGLTPGEDAIIDRALREAYALHDITPDSDFSKVTPPLMSELQTVLENMEGGKDLAIRLEKFTRGSFAGFFNQPTNITLKNKLVVFSIRDLEEELRPMAMYIILHYIWNLIRSEMKKRILVIDEAWWLMQHPEGASFLFGIAKRCRKYYLGLTTITQDVADFINSPYGKPIITNSSIQLLMKQSPATIEAVKGTFNLTDQEKYMLLEGSVGEGIFFAGTKHVAIKVIASYTEDQIITSDPRQLLEMEKAKEELSQNQ